MMGVVKVLRRGEELRKCGVSKGSAVQVRRRVRSGRRHEVTRREQMTGVGRATLGRGQETNRHVKRRRPVPGLEQKEESKQEGKDEAQRRAQETREERAQETREETRDTDAKSREKQPREARTPAERETEVKVERSATNALEEQGEQKRGVEAQATHDSEVMTETGSEEEGERTMQE